MSCSCTSAHAIPAGHADASIATRAAATAAGLDFLPLITEHFDVFLSRRDCYRTRLRAALNIIAELTFATRRLGCVESASRQVGTVRGRQENQIRLHGFVRDGSEIFPLVLEPQLIVWAIVLAAATGVAAAAVPALRAAKLDPVVAIRG
jgi:PBP superfamily domain